MLPESKNTVLRALRVLGWSLALAAAVAPPASARRFPNVVVVTVDTLRADHLSSYGYSRQTSPHIDRLLNGGARFTEARTVEPLTNPALSSLITSRYPHEHGASRNGLPMRSGLPSFVKQLQRRGFSTAAFVGNWTLKDEISGLAEHFDEYHEVLSRKRWLIMKGEATADDITELSLDWIEQQAASDPNQPFLLWVHYVEPHAPYRSQRTVLDQLGLATDRDLPPKDRYDSEIAFVDRSIGLLVDGIDAKYPAEETLYVFAADHGESLGEHRYWGHGRNLYEPGLRIPLGFKWSGQIPPTTVEQPSTLLDVGPTVLGLIGYPIDRSYVGLDWSDALTGTSSDAVLPADRVIYLQAHKGAVQGVEDRKKARQRGLLQVGLVRQGRKEILDLPKSYLVFDLQNDPREKARRDANETPSRALSDWHQEVVDGLAGADSLPVPELDEEGEEQMRSLGYID